eukprot:9683669-Heterocapsa_arctica.AAC.1
MEPGTFTVDSDPGASTCHTGNTLDWFIVSGGLALSAEAKVEGDTPIYAHYPVKLRIGEKKPELEVPEGEFIRKEGTLDEDWQIWNESSGNYLGQVEGTLGQEHEGRGQQLTYVKNAKSAPQDNSE